MTFFQEVHRKVGGVADRRLAIALAIEAGALGEEVEGTLWIVHLKTRNLLGEFHDEVLATLEGLTHVLHTLLVARECSFSSLLRHRARTRGVLTLKLVAALHNPVGCSDETNTPTGHRVSLRHTIDDHHTILDVVERSH